MGVAVVSAYTDSNATMRVSRFIRTAARTVTAVAALSLVTIAQPSKLPAINALWVYSVASLPSPVTDAPTQAALIQNSSASGVNMLYVSVYSSTPDSAGRYLDQESDIAALITSAHTQGIAVYAALGDPDWPSSGCAVSSTPYQRFADIAGYDSGNPSAKFDGIILDVEPGSSPDFSALLGLYQCFQQLANAKGLGLAAAISAFWTTPVNFNQVTEEAYKQIVDLKLTNLVVMGYRNTAGTLDCTQGDGLLCLDEEIVAYANTLSLGNMILVGLNTDNPATSGDLAEETFYSLGQAPMNAAAQSVFSQFAAINQNFGGFAINNYRDSYLNGLLPGWPATNPSRPLGVNSVRDFAGNGLSGALLYDPDLGQSYTALSLGNGTYQYVGNLFTPGFDTLRTGDFNGDGVADLVLYNSQTALAYIGFGDGNGTFMFQSLFWSPGYDTVEMGDLNNDGKTDVALYNSLTGTLYTAISNGTGGFTYKYTLISEGFTFVRLADFTGDGKADIFLYNANTGLAFVGVGDGSGGFTFKPLSIAPGYNLVDIGDLNGDGKMDVILYNSANGNAATGISDGSGGFAFTPLIFSPGFTSVRLADYTGDGNADVTLYDKNTAVAYFGTGTGTGTFNFQSLFWSPGYDSVIPEDVNGDGLIDVELYNSTTGTEYTGINNGDGTFTYTYQYWGIGKVLAR